MQRNELLDTYGMPGRNSEIQPYHTHKSETEQQQQEQKLEPQQQQETTPQVEAPDIFERPPIRIPAQDLLNGC